MKQSILLIIFSFLFLFPEVQLTAQDQTLNPCGTDLGISSWLRDFQSRIHSTSRTDGIVYVPLQIHILGTDQGSGYMQYNTVMRAFCQLNEDFADSEIQFFLASPVNYIDNTAYYDHADFETGRDMMIFNNVPNAINCYIVQSPAGNCGYYSPGPDAIALAKSCIQPGDHTWAHEVGHFLSLPHPFYGWEYRSDESTHNYNDPAPEFWTADWGTNYYVEKVDGSNCQFAADGFCDTAPDYLDYRWSCNLDGVSTVTQHDPNGVPFVSNGDLFMSYSNDFCAARFSDDQTAAMRANLEEERPELFSIPPDENSIIIPAEEFTSVLSPAPDAVIESSSVLLEWEPIPNATHYLVQVNPFSIFSIIFNQYIVDEPRLVFENLLDNKTFYWRIKPLNNYYTCVDFMEPNSFETGLVSATQELLPGENLSIYPNPVNNNNNASLELTSTVTEKANWQITNTTGQLLSSGQFGTITGTQRIDLPTHQLTPGLYIVRVQIGDRQAVRKMIIQ
jgi:hypothetical protein